MLRSLLLAPYVFSSLMTDSSPQFFSSPTSFCFHSRTTRRLSESVSQSSPLLLILASICSRGRSFCVLITRRWPGYSRRNLKLARWSVAGSRRYLNTRLSLSTSRAQKIPSPTCSRASKVTPLTRSYRLNSRTALSRLRALFPTPITSSYGPTGLTSSASTKQSLELCAASTSFAN